MVSCGFPPQTKDSSNTRISDGFNGLESTDFDMLAIRPQILFLSEFTKAHHLTSEKDHIFLSLRLLSGRWQPFRRMNLPNQPIKIQYSDANQ
jgi:hypothetical protein